MVHTAAPPDYCDNDVRVIVQQAPSGVNSLEEDRLDIGGGTVIPTFQIVVSYPVIADRRLRYPSKTVLW